MIKLSALAPLAVTAAFVLSAGSLSAQHTPKQHSPGDAPTSSLPVAEKPPQVSFAEGIKADPQLTIFFTDLAEALRTHDGRRFVPRLADNFAIEGHAAEGAKYAFVGSMRMITPPLEIIVTGIEPADRGGRTVKTDFTFAKRTARRFFTLDSAGKLVGTNLVSMKGAAGEDGAGRKKHVPPFEHGAP